MTKRWSRLGQISADERSCLEAVTDKTKGMALYGNKARLAVMVETDLAYMISTVCKNEGISVGELCARLLRTQFSCLSGLVNLEPQGQFTVDRDQLILSLSLHYGGFLDLSKSSRFVHTKKTQINVGERSATLLLDDIENVLSVYEQTQVFWYKETSNDFSIGCDLREIKDGYIILSTPIEQHIYNFLTQIVCK